MASAQLITGTLFRRELRQLLRIAWPLFIAQSAQMGTGVVDTIMAARYNDQDLAAISIGINIWLPIYLLILGTIFATATIVAQDFGGGRIEKIRQQLPQSLWVAVFLGVTLSPLLWYADPALALLGLNPTTRELALDYTQMVALGMPATAIFQALRYHTQGLGITQPFAFAAVAGFLVNVPLNYAFIFGEWGAPELGAQGCGIATAISMWLSAIIISIYILTKPSIQQYLPPWKPVAPDPTAIKEILVLGAPVGATMFMETGVFAVIALMVSSLGDVAIGAHQIAFNVWDMFYIPMLAIGAAMATRMGHAIGAQDKPGVYMALRAGLLCSITVSLITMAILLSFPNTIVGIYSESPAMKVLAARLLTFAALFVIIDAIQIVGSFAMRAYKKTRFPFIASMVAYWIIALPLGYYLGLVRADNASDGAAGFWIAIILGVFVATVMVAVRVVMLLRQPLPKDFEAMAES